MQQQVQHGRVSEDHARVSQHISVGVLGGAAALAAAVTVVRLRLELLLAALSRLGGGRPYGVRELSLGGIIQRSNFSRCSFSLRPTPFQPRDAPRPPLPLRGAMLCSVSMNACSSFSRLPSMRLSRRHASKHHASLWHGSACAHTDRQEGKACSGVTQLGGQRTWHSSAAVPLSCSAMSSCERRVHTAGSPFST
jgi:hypothetical protein